MLMENDVRPFNHPFNMDFHESSGSYLTWFFIMPANEDEELGPDGKKIRPGISATVISELTDCNAALSQQRKKRQVFWL